MPMLNNILFTASVNACTVILHDESADAILKRFIQFAKSSNDQVNQIIDVSISFFFIINGFDILLLNIIFDSIETVDSIIYYFHYLFRYKLFLYKCYDTSPQSILRKVILYNKQSKHFQVFNNNKKTNNQLNMSEKGKDQNKQAAKIKQFYLGSRERFITISSNFDSGNIKVVRQLSEFQYRLQCVEDCTFTSKPIGSKSWFYFQVKGFPKNTKGRFFISKIQALASIYYSKYNKCYRPVYRVNQQKWQRIKTEVPLSLLQNGQIQCQIQYLFQNEGDIVEFAFCYPYQYKKHVQFINSLNIVSNDKEIFFSNEILIYSPEERPINLLTISSQEENIGLLQDEQFFNNNLFPQKIKRPKRIKKPVVLISARVHPGQTPASYTMEGLINFLLDKDDLRAHMLRKMFVFMIVPMINVDGVYHGHFRMDIYGKNLNRFYINPSLKQQPAIYAIKQLAIYLKKQDRLSFYFDLHSHNSKKGCFIYGNAFNDFVEQVQSQIFCKLFSMNHSGFQYEYCNFSQKHMIAKDRFEDLTKQGCGRVVMHKTANIIHSYSVQCGIISPNITNIISEPSNADFKIKTKGLSANQSKEIQGQIIAYDNSTIFNEDSYRSLGKNLLVSILDVFDKNPYNRVYTSKYKSMQMLRRLTAFEIFHSAERFRMFEKYIFGKVKNINLLIHDLLKNKHQYKPLYNCNFSQDEELKEIQWPKNILGLSKGIKYELKSKKIKSYSQTKPNFIEQVQKTHKIQSVFVRIKGMRQSQKQKEGQTIQLNSEANLKFKMQQNSQTRELAIKSAKNKTNYFYEQNVYQNNDSDHSQVQETQINQQILKMCENENEQNQILNKVLQNQFNQQDYQKIQQKFYNKNTLETAIKKQSSISYENASKTYSVNAQTIQKMKPLSLKDNKNKITKPNKFYYYTKNNVSNHNKSIKLHENTTDVQTVQRQQITEIKKLTAAEQFRRNIYDSIKQEIKDNLRKQYEKRQTKQKHQYKLMDSFRMNNNNNKKNNKAFNGNTIVRLRSKVKLPSLGSNMYIIMTSTKLMNKN